MEMMKQYNNDIKTLIGKGYSKATWVKYETTKKHVEEFVKWKYSVTDLDIKKLNFEFITDFEFRCVPKRTLASTPMANT